ncbi:MULTISPECIES: septation protein SepH [unclassified Nocardioides]|uniref:septation protein SepH n=1 Tax=unclassified Nocardioides TaxID=2615069 RepID=UPI000056F9DF|nr:MULTISPECIES: septation protein SepH [unclassified Nocardioides]ABL82418.1 DNA-binding protein [Nocardioides sp. JS614]
MAHLTLAGVSDDGTRLRLVDDEGVEHTVDVDDRLRAALRGDPTRRLETKMDSVLRPRDIQARIRAGETPEAVAQAAQTSVDKIMAFAAPVLAERQHVAERAQRSSVRRTDGGHAASGARTLGDAAASHLRSANVDPETVEWDAWRREDGRWSLTASYSSPERSGTAELTFDAPGNYVTLDNEDARWLVGEAVAAAPPAQDDLRHARQRRLSAVGDLDQELPLGEDAIGLVSEQPVEAFLDDEPPADPEVAAEAAELREEAVQAAAEDDLHRGELEEEQPPAEHHHEPPVRRPVKKTRGRASVPSWDEIMFGPSGSDGA